MYSKERRSFTVCGSVKPNVSLKKVSSSVTIYASSQIDVFILKVFRHRHPDYILKLNTGKPIPFQNQALKIFKDNSSYEEAKRIIDNEVELVKNEIKGIIKEVEKVPFYEKVVSI